MSQQRLPSSGKFFFDVLLESSNCQDSGEVYFPDACLVGISNQSMFSGGSSSLLGSTPLSWGFRVDGKIVHNKAVTAYAPHFSNLSDKKKHVKHVIRVCVDCSTGQVSFMDNGVDRGVAFVIARSEWDTPLYAAASFASSSHEATFT